MNNSIVFLGVCFVLMLIISGFATLAYVLIYKAIVNRRVQAVNAGTAAAKKAPPSPIKMFFVFLIIGTLFFIMLIVFLIFSYMSYTHFESSSEHLIGDDIEMPDTYAVFYEAGENDPLADISPEQEITGYVRREVTDGDYRFVYYTEWSDTPVFPKVMIYAEYTGGEGRNLYYETDCNENNADEVYESNSDGFLINKKGGWFVVDSQNFMGTVTLSMLASNDVTERDTDKRNVVSTGTLKIDYNDYFSPDALEAAWDEHYDESTDSAA